MKPCICNVWVFSLKVCLLNGQLWLVSVHVKFNQTSQVKYVFISKTIYVFEKKERKSFLLEEHACYSQKPATLLTVADVSGGFSDAACNIACNPPVQTKDNELSPRSKL